MEATNKVSTNGAKPSKKAAKKSAKATAPRARKPKKELTALEATMIAWEDTYAKRHQRLD